MSKLNTHKEAQSRVAEKVVQNAINSALSIGNIASKSITTEIVTNNSGGYYDNSGNWITYLRCDTDNIGSGLGCAP